MYSTYTLCNTRIIYEIKKKNYKTSYLEYQDSHTNGKMCTCLVVTGSIWSKSIYKNEICYYYQLILMFSKLLEVIWHMFYEYSVHTETIAISTDTAPRMYRKLLKNINSNEFKLQARSPIIIMQIPKFSCITS